MNFTNSIKKDSNDPRLISKIDITGLSKNNKNNSTAVTQSAERVLISPNKRESSSKNNELLSKKYSSNKVYTYDNLGKKPGLNVKEESQQNLNSEMQVQERIIYPEEESKIKAALAKHFLFQDLNEDTM